MSPGRCDPAVVRRHLLALDTALQTLRGHQGRPLEALDIDREERWIVERGLQLCVQNVIDVATHLVVSAGRDVPDYGTAIDHLGDLDIVPKAFASRLRPMAGFRNVIVHGYLDIDVTILHRLLNERLDDLVEFAKLVTRYLESRAD